MKTHCCPDMTDQVNFACPDHPDGTECPDRLIHYSEKSGEYGIIVHDGGSSWVGIGYCPWCGTTLS